MKIAITSKGKELTSNMDSRFGRCSYFIIYNTENKDYEAIENMSAQVGGGAGPKAAQILSEKNVKILLTGNVGPNAHKALNAAGITIYTGISGKVSDAVSSLDEKEPAERASVEPHCGMN